jgi:CRISPR/Cas system-associated exonuclease Cas4 (RecB family)
MSRTSFLNSVARSLYQQYGERIADCCLVFPGRRAGLFFQKELSQYIKREIWMPRTLVINQLTEEITGEKATDHLILLTELYQIYRSLTGKEDSLQEFYTLGNIIIRDFDQTDKYLLDPAQLFHNVRDLKRISVDFSFLSPEQQEVIKSFWSSFQAKPDHTLNLHFMHLWENLPPLYKAFNHLLNEKGYAYEGMIYRKMVTRLEGHKGPAFLDRYSGFAFIGFNALNTCEKALFRYLKNIDKALFYWDYDPYYIENPIQEAGMFLRKNMKEFPPADGYVKDVSPLRNPRNIHVIPTPSYVLQAKIVPQLLKKHNLPYNTDTAVVLADENLLLQLLYGLGYYASPEQEINVTMGFPLRQTSLFSLIDSLLRYYNNTKTTRDFRPVEMHPYVRSLDLAHTLRNVPANTPDLYNLLLSILEKVDHSESITAGDPLLIPVVRETRKQLNKLYLAVTQSGMDIHPEVFSRLLKQHLSLASIPFSGEPLTGLQVMGFLETRCLDFENVIIVSAQENMLPKAYRDNSLIPYNIRKAFGLPAAEQHTAMQAYYFYRLIQRSSNVFLIWNRNPEGPSKGELSRFIRQIRYELPDSQVVTTPVLIQHTIPEIKPISIPKSGIVKEALERYRDPDSGQYVSPSALQTYIRCPLSFYFKNILLLKEPLEVSDQADPLHLGNIVHRTLEHLYRPVLGKTLSGKEISGLIEPRAAFRETVTRIANDYLIEQYGNDRSRETGKWILFTEVATLYVERFVKHDVHRAPLVVSAVEKMFRRRYNNINIKGIIDRVDLSKGQAHIIDYKTGTEKNAFSKTEDLFNPELTVKNRDAFQILCYTFLEETQAAGNTFPIPLLFYLNATFSDKPQGYILLNKTALNDPAVFPVLKEDFLGHLNCLLEEMFNFNTPFRQTDHPDNCLHCPYISICQREKYND